MIKSLMNLKIRVKLLAAFGSILVLSVLLIALSVSSIEQIIKYKTVNEEVDNLKLHLQTLDLATKNFMYEEFKSSAFLKNHESSSITIFEESYLEANAIILEINKSDITDSKETEQLSHSLLTTLDSLHGNFFELVSLLKSRGFKDNGLEGSLRNAIHEVENSGFAFDKASMLTLRRHEKDFFLRKDLKYQDEFNTKFDNFYNEVEPLLGATLSSALKNYKMRFNSVVEIEKRIGLKEDVGIRGKIKTYFESMRPQLEKFRLQTKEKNEAQIAKTKNVLWIIFSVQIIAGLGMALVYANLLTKSIKEIRSAILKLASGIFPGKLQVRTTEEIGQTKLAFNQFIDRLKSATQFAEQLGNGQLAVDYDQHYAGDVLAQSLIRAQKKLRDAEERQHKINWANEGIAKFNEILKNESDVILLSDQVLALLVNYVKANQGALYLHKRDTNGEYLERTATYAYEKKRCASQHVAIGEGVIGQCFLEASTVYMKNVPSNFVKITSGLGAATPRNIVITPLKIRSAAVGVIEMASFQVFQDFEINFIERIAESIATLLVDKQNAESAKALIEKSVQNVDDSISSESPDSFDQELEDVLASFVNHCNN